MATNALRARRALLYTVLGLGAFVAILPLLYMVANSLKTYGETITRVSASPFNPRFWPSTPQWGNYPEAWEEGNLGRYFVNSVVITATTLVGTLLVTIPAAFAFSKMRFPAKDTVFTILIATLLVPETVLLFPNYLIVSRLGWIDRLPALTVPFFGSAFFIFFLRQFFNQVPNSIIESAHIDGAGHLFVMTRIVAPLARAPIFTTSFLIFTTAWNALQWPLVVTQTSRWRPISVGLSSFLSEATALIHLRMAGAIVGLAPVVLVYFVAQRQITEAIARTGLKG